MLLPSTVYIRINQFRYNHRKAKFLFQISQDDIQVETVKR